MFHKKRDYITSRKLKFDRGMRKCLNWLRIDSRDRRGFFVIGAYVAFLVIGVEFVLWVIQGIAGALRCIGL